MSLLLRIDQPFIKVLVIMVQGRFIYYVQGLFGELLHTTFSRCIIVQVEMNCSVLSHDRNTALQKGKGIQDKEIGGCEFVFRSEHLKT